MPKMTHPNSKQTIDVSPAQVAMYASQGWETKAPAAKKATPPQSKPASTSSE